MKVNDVLRKKEVAFRVLAMKDDYCFCINCKTDFMPAWMPISTLNEYTPDIAPLIDINMTARQKQVAHERFTMIAPMLAFLTDDKERNRIMNRLRTARGLLSPMLDRAPRRTASRRRMGPAAPSLSSAAQKGSLYGTAGLQQAEQVSGRSKRASRGHVPPVN